MKGFFQQLAKQVQIFLFSLIAFSVQLNAEIPTTDDFAKGIGERSAVETLFWLLETFVQVIVLGLAAYFVIIIGKAAITKYNEITDGRGNWIDLGGHVIGGIALLTLTIVILNWIGTWVK